MAVSVTRPSNQSRSHVGRMARSAVGGISGAVSHFLSGASSVRAPRRFLRRQLWAWPVLAAVLFGGIGWWVHRSVERAMREQRMTDLNAIVEASVTSVRVWMGEQGNNVTLIA